MDKNMLEFWGQAFLNAARNQQQLENMSKYFGQSPGTDNQIMNSFFKALGWQNVEKMKPEEILEFAKKSVNAYQEFFKAYLAIFDIVSKEEYLNMVKENEELKEKIAQQEKIIQSYKNLSGKDVFDQEEVVTNLTQIVKKQTQQFQELMSQMNQYYEEGSKAKNK